MKQNALATMMRQYLTPTRMDQIEVPLQKRLSGVNAILSLGAEALPQVSGYGVFDRLNASTVGLDKFPQKMFVCEDRVSMLTTGRIAGGVLQKIGTPGCQTEHCTLGMSPRARLRHSSLSNRETQRVARLSAEAKNTPQQGLSRQGVHACMPAAPIATQVKFDCDNLLKNIKALNHLKSAEQGLSGKINTRLLQNVSVPMLFINHTKDTFDLSTKVWNHVHSGRLLSFTQHELVASTYAKKHGNDYANFDSPHLRYFFMPCESSRSMFFSCLGNALSALKFNIQKQLFNIQKQFAGLGNRACGLQLRGIKLTYSRTDEATGSMIEGMHVKHTRTVEGVRVEPDVIYRLSRSALDGILNAAKRIGSSDIGATPSATTGHTIHFAPVIHISSEMASGNVQGQVQAAVQNAYAEFERNMARFLRDQNRVTFN